MAAESRIWSHYDRGARQYSSLCNSASAAYFIPGANFASASRCPKVSWATTTNLETWQANLNFNGGRVVLTGSLRHVCCCPTTIELQHNFVATNNLVVNTKATFSSSLLVPWETEFGCLRQQQQKCRPRRNSTTIVQVDSLASDIFHLVQTILAQSKQVNEISLSRVRLRGEIF